MKLRQDRKIIKDKHIRIATDYNAGMLIKDICKKYGCSVGSVYYAIHKEVGNETN